MIPELTILFSGFVLVVFLIAIIKESTVLFILDAAFSFIMAVMVRLILYPYSFIDNANVVVTGNWVFDDSTACIIFFLLGVIDVILYFAFRVQHSAEELQEGVKEE